MSSRREVIDELERSSIMSRPRRFDQGLRRSPLARRHFQAAPIFPCCKRAAERLSESAGRKKAKKKPQNSFSKRASRLSQIYRKLETCGKPFAIAINGTCLGGAFELALACHYRVIADNDKARVGLPEIKVGLFPGAGGTQRVARLMQTGDALQMLFKGEQIRPKAAKTMNLVHEVAPADDIVAKAKAWIAAGGKGVAPWDEQGLQASFRKSVFAAGHDGMAGRQRDLPARDA